MKMDVASSDTGLIMLLPAISGRRRMGLAGVEPAAIMTARWMGPPPSWPPNVVRTPALGACRTSVLPRGRVSGTVAASLSIATVTRLPNRLEGGGVDGVAPRGVPAAAAL